MYLTLALCGLGLGAMVFKYDLHRTEPWWLLLVATVLGAGMMEAAGQAQLALIRVLSGADGHSFPGNTMLAFLAGSSEEVAKFMVVVIIACASRRHFDEPVDGLIYGAFAGLGAALAESISTLGFGQHSPFLPAQEPIRLAGHLIMGGIGGFGIGLMTSHSRYRFIAIPGFLLVAIVVHTLWDIIAFHASDVVASNKPLHIWHTVLPIILMVAGMIVFRWLISLGCRLTRAHLQT